MDEPEDGERGATLRWLAGLESPTELLLQAIRHDVEFFEEPEALDRVPETDFPALVEAVSRHLPGRVADEVGQLLLLQSPELTEEFASRLSHPETYIWGEECWDGHRSLVLLPAHHVAFPEGAIEVRDPGRWTSLASPSPTWWPRAEATATGRVGGAAQGRCPACGWELQRVLDLGTIVHPDGLPLPREVVACVAFNCLWADQFFTHEDEDGAPRPLPRADDLPETGQPRPQRVPELTVSFHPAPARWQVQDWGASNDRQNLNRLGGPASWVQDAIHPDCPGCARPVPFLAQLDGATRFVDGPGWAAWTEGMVYTFWCADCRVSAVTSQQT